MNKRLYPKNWKKKVRPDILKRDNYTCQQCGVRQYAVGYFDAAGRYVPIRAKADASAIVRATLNRLGTQGPDHKDERGLQWAKQWLRIIARRWPEHPWQVMILAVAHLDQNTRNNDPDNLKTFCQRCHFAYDRCYNVPKLVHQRKYGKNWRKNQLGFNFSLPLFADPPPPDS